MKHIQLTKELAKSIVASNAFKNYLNTQNEFNDNVVLQEKIEKFNFFKIQISEEMAKEAKDDAKIEQLNQDLQNLYQEIMEDPISVAYEFGKTEIDTMMQQVNIILSAALKGDDIDSISVDEPAGGECNAGGCGGCNGGCH